MEDPVKCPFKQLWKRMEKSISTSEGKFQVNLCLKSTRTRQNLTSPKSVASKNCASTINPHKKKHPTFIHVSPIFPCFTLRFAFFDLLATSRMATAICQQPALPQALINAPKVMLSGASCWSCICCHNRSAWRQEASQAPRSGDFSPVTQGIYHQYIWLSSQKTRFSHFRMWVSSSNSISPWSTQRAPVPLAAMARMAAFKVTVSKRSFLRCRVDSRAKAFGQPASAWVACLWTTIPMSL